MKIENKAIIVLINIGSDFRRVRKIAESDY